MSRARSAAAIMFAVVACPRCRRSRIVEQGRKTASCGSCGRSLVLADLRTYFTGEAFEEAQHAAGLLNAKLAGREGDYAMALLPAEPPRPRHDTPHEAAAAAARGAGSETERVDRLARALGARLGEFTADDLAQAFERAGIPPIRAEAHLARMQETTVVFEPRSGRYRAF